MASAAFASAADQITALRGLCGQGTSSALLSDAAMTYSLQAARREVNRRRPKYQFGHFTTTATTKQYSGASAGTPPTSALDELKVYWRGDGSVWVPGLLFDTYELWDPTDAQLIEFARRPLTDVDRKLLKLLLADGTAYLSQEMIQEAIEGFDHLNKRFSGRAWEDAGTITLEPTPTTTGTSVYWMAKVPRITAPELVGEDFVEALMTYATKLACEALAAIHSHVARVETGTGKSIASAAGVQYAGQAQRAAYRFEAICPLATGIAAV